MAGRSKRRERLEAAGKWPPEGHPAAERATWLEGGGRTHVFQRKRTTVRRDSLSAAQDEALAHLKGEVDADFYAQVEEHMGLRERELTVPMTTPEAKAARHKAILGTQQSMGKRDVKDRVLATFEHLGEEAFTAWAIENLDLFYGMWAKLLPSKQELDILNRMADDGRNVRENIADLLESLSGPGAAHVEGQLALPAAGAGEDG